MIHLPADLLGPTAFGRILGRHPLTALDVGSRGGFEPDLAPIAFAVDAVGFEPEPEAYAALAKQPRGPWRSLRHLPVAVGGTDGDRTLYITRDPQSSSLLKPDAAIGAAFAKPDFCTVAREVTVATLTLDTIAARHGLTRPAYLKLDIEGAEKEVLDASTGMVADLLAIKTEVGFVRFRHHQPLAAELDLSLREAGFELMDFFRPARWRIEGTVIHPQAEAAAIPYSRGRLMHGDYLFLRRPETIAEPERKLQLAALAMAHGFFDHALQILQRPEMTDWLKREHGAGPESLVAEASIRFGRAAWRRLVLAHLRLIWTYGRSALALWGR